jgi:hypothetical protein
MISNDKFCGLKQPKNTKTPRFREVFSSLMGFAFAIVDPERLAGADPSFLEVTM